MDTKARPIFWFLYPFLLLIKVKSTYNAGDLAGFPSTSFC